MAEETKTVDQLNAEITALKQKGVALDSVEEKTRKMAEAISFSQDAMGKVVSATTAAAGGVFKFGERTENVSGLLLKFGAAAVAVGTDIGRALINPVSDSGDAMRKLLPEVSRVNDGIKQLIVVQNAARQAIVLLGGGLADADSIASKYPQTLRNMSAMLSISTKDLHSMTSVIQQVPGAISEASGSLMGIGKLAGTTIQPMAILATTMTAFGMDAKAAAEFGKRGFFEFGQTIPDTLKRVGLMADAAKQTGVDMKTTQEQIEGAGKGLAIFGQGSAVAAGTWTTFMTSLKGSGVPIGEIGKMVTSLTGSFANMALQTKAAISSFSGMGGGRTAIGGALQMEINMRTPGGLEKNIEMMTSTLSKFAGGRIITLEEAAANPQLEAQFVVQRNMLAKLSGITDQEQQNRILETMQNVQRGGISQVEGGKALEDVFMKGKDIQTQELTFLDKIEQNTKAAIGKELNLDEIVGNANRKMLVGITSPEERERGTSRSLSGMGEGFGTNESVLTSSKWLEGAETFGLATREIFNMNKNTMDVAKAKPGPSTMDVGMSGGIIERFKRGFLGSDVLPEKSPPEARLASRPTHATVMGDPLSALKPEYQRTSGLLFKISDIIQKGDDSKTKLMEQMLAAVQQQRKAEMPIIPTGEAVTRRAVPPVFEEGGGKSITVKIIGDETRVRQIIEEALARRSTAPLGHDN